MPYKSKKQEMFLRKNKPEVAKKFDKDIKKMKKMKKMKKQTGSDKTNEKQGMEIRDLKKKVKKENKWMLHIKKVRKENKGMSYKEAMVKAKQSYKK